MKPSSSQFNPKSTIRVPSGRPKWIAPWVMSGLILFATAGCVGGGEPSPAVTPVATAPELSRYRDAASGQTAIEWAEPASAGWDGTPDALGAAEQSIRAAGQQLAAVDYTALSLPDFVTYTHAYAPHPEDFTGRGVEVEAYGTGREDEH